MPWTPLSLNPGTKSLLSQDFQSPRAFLPSVFCERHDLHLLVTQGPTATDEPPSCQPEHGLDISRTQEHLPSSSAVRGAQQCPTANVRGNVEQSGASLGH